MPTYADLSPYQYTQHEPGVLNVGWLGRESVFATAEPDPEFLRALVRGAQGKSHVLRGLHRCEMCDLDPDRLGVLISDHGTVRYWDRSIEEPPAWLGTGEIRVEAGNGEITYAAPSLIVHYVLDHQYAPPAQFVAAMLRQYGD